jgi:hypothetical protein
MNINALYESVTSSYGSVMPHNVATGRADKRYSPNEYATVAIAACLSIAAAAIYTTLIATGFWPSVIQRSSPIAGAIHTFIFARFEAPSGPQQPRASAKTSP